MQPFCIYITGIPGSGKSTIAIALKKELEKKNINVEILRLDEIRKIVTPDPKYTDDERDIVYRSLAYMAYILYKNKINVIIDATAHKREYRNLARSLIKNFYEIYIKCSLDTASEREKNRIQNLVQKNLYQKAKEGKISLPGINIPYQEPENPELIINSEELSPIDSARKIIEILKI